MNFIYTVLAFLLALGPLVVFHEFGHYIVARLCGVKVLRFSVGMGKIVWARRFGRDQTEWALSALPIGGYVKMLDKRDPSTAPADDSELDREFTSQNVWKRIAIIAAGPIANFILAIAVLAGLFMHGVEEPSARLAPGAATSAAWQAGIRGGDVVTAINGDPVRSWPELRLQVLGAAVDKREADLELRGASGGSYRAVIPAAAMAKLDVDGDVMNALGMDMWRPPALLGEVMAGGAGARAGLKKGDLVTAIDGKPVPDWIALTKTVSANAGRVLDFSVTRAGQQMHIPVSPTLDQATGRGMIKAAVGAQPELVNVVSAPLPAVGIAARVAWDQGTMMLKMIGKMIIGEVSVKNVAGPITIADAAGQSAHAGLAVFLRFVAFISISLGVMNLLPIPVLDGGHLLYYAVEVLTGRPLPARIGEIAQRAGVGLLFMLMALAVFNDLVRLL
ncbi:RIP metalloprotease RseP [Massilia terrae]|uniref:Zinc metalloprotease n=1 Tax=Massilia terrae TaxID=1811224 RepID=A0ABT2CV53_9BURK|nr:RIP metalloprotease RseP [Massilia terrae]MCS0657080.1 RIP metalloprotease RseP [Massilia terrae]